MPTDLAGKFWDLSNAIVAFSVLQMIAFLYALARQDFRDAVANMYQPVRRAIAASCLLYSGGVIACCFAEIRSLPSAVGDAHSLRWLTCIIRVLVILLYSGFAIGILRFGNNHHWNQTPDPPLVGNGTNSVAGDQG